MPAIRACLEHRHSYVRRNAVLAIYTIYRYQVYSFPYFLSAALFIDLFPNFKALFSREKRINDGTQLPQEL